MPVTLHKTTVMKKIFTIILSISSLLSFGQVPLQDLIFAHDFAGTFNAAVPQNLEPYANTGTLTEDLIWFPQSAISFEPGQNMRFYNDFLQAGSTNGQLTVSLKFQADFNTISNMEQNTYANLYNSGDCFIRILKTSTYFIQIGLYNGNTNAASFGYITVAYNVDASTLSNWNNVSLVYIGNPANQSISLFHNGQPVVGISNNFECEQGGNVIYQNFDMVIGGLDDKPLDAVIDEVYIHNRALSNEEIQAIHSSSSFVSVSEVQKTATLEFYPNPAQESIFIDSENSEVIEIIDAQGARVLSQKLNTGRNQINISQLAAGIYFVKQNQQMKKLIIT